MRVTRAYIAGIGTTGSLVAAAICTLIVVGAIVAFNGWPGSGLGSSQGQRMVVDDSGRQAAPVAVRTRAVSPAAASASAAAATVAPKPSGPPVLGNTTSLGAVSPATSARPGGPTGGGRTLAGPTTRAAPAPPAAVAAPPAAAPRAAAAPAAAA